ncbi:MAG: PorV/PorQ family protein [Rhodothermales bacterium]|nr:PorV/PorQ family protein [Rhodothermales bacterium]MCA0268234.1 PorV/PorQ family protein [Bacteroidota bacterium]
MRSIFLSVAAVGLLLPGVGQAQDKTGTTAAAFLGIGVGARATGMGSANVAAAQGPSALYWNPSGITDMSQSGIEFSTTAYLVDTRFSNASAVLDLGQMGHLGLSVTNLNYGDDLVTTVDRPDGTGERWSANDLMVGVSYARALTDRFSVGGTVKAVRQQIYRESATGFALDLGVMYRIPFRNTRIGMAMTNFGTDMQLAGPDLRQAIDLDLNTNGGNDRLEGQLSTSAWALPISYHVGVAMDAYRSGQHALLVTADAAAPSDNAQNVSVGGEYAFRDLFYVRGGYRQAFTKSQYDQGWSAGAGIRYAVSNRYALRADYVFQEMEPFGTPQTLSVGFTF